MLQAVIRAAMIAATASLVLLPAQLANANSSPLLHATLDGQPIDPRAAGNYFCHDFLYPEIRCFSENERLEQDVEQLEAVTGLLGITASYVQVFEHIGYAGNTAKLSQDYSDLSSIGWNDVISSYKVSSMAGAFWEHVFFSGLKDSFCCGQWVSDVGGTFNDKFSSLDRTS